MELILTTKEELTSVVNNALNGFMDNLKLSSNSPQKRWLNLAETVGYINNRGIKISKGTLYSLTHKKEIPFLKNGIHVVFDQEELDEWIKKRVERKGTGPDPVSASARRKSLCPHK